MLRSPLNAASSSAVLSSCTVQRVSIFLAHRERAPQPASRSTSHIPQWTGVLVDAHAPELSQFLGDFADSEEEIESHADQVCHVAQFG